MDNDNYSEVTMTRKIMKKETDIFSKYINCEINTCANVSNQQYIDENNQVQTMLYVKQEREKSSEGWESCQGVELKPSIVHKSEREEIHVENIKVENDIFSDDQNLDEKHDSSSIMEFIEVRHIKDECVEGYDKKEDIYDPLKINEGKEI